MFEKPNAKATTSEAEAPDSDGSVRHSVHGDGHKAPPKADGTTIHRQALNAAGAFTGIKVNLIRAN